MRCRLADHTWTGVEACCNARRAFDKRTPGLFKVVWSGDGLVGLCSKTYYYFGATDKYNTKGLSKRHNAIDKDAFLVVLTNRQSGSGNNRGFRVRHSIVLTYVQERAALTYFYVKRVVHEDGLSTGPVDVLKRRCTLIVVHTRSWMHGGNILSRASSPDRRDAVKVLS